MKTLEYAKPLYDLKSAKEDAIKCRYEIVGVTETENRIFLTVIDPLGYKPKIKTKDFTERTIELIKEDKELHDATVRLINAMAAEKEEKVKRMQMKREKHDL